MFKVLCLGLLPRIPTQLSPSFISILSKVQFSLSLTMTLTSSFSKVISVMNYTKISLYLYSIINYYLIQFFKAWNILNRYDSVNRMDS
jgi:hypothetical protein